MVVSEIGVILLARGSTFSSANRHLVSIVTMLTACITFIEEEDDDTLDGEEETDEPLPEFMNIIESENGWQGIDKHTRIPPLSIKHIHEYFIQHRVKKEHVTATKPFERAYRIFQAKNVYIHPPLYIVSSVLLFYPHNAKIVSIRLLLHFIIPHHQYTMLTVHV